MITVQATWDGTYTSTCAKRIKLPQLKGVWIHNDVQLLEEPYVDEQYGLVALAIAFGALCFVKIKINVT